MEEAADSAVSIRTGKLSMICEKEISAVNQKLDFTMSSLKTSLQMISTKAQEAPENEAKLKKVKGDLKDLEGELEKALSVKIRKEAKKAAILDSILQIRSITEELKKKVQEQKKIRVEKAEILQKQSADLDACEGENKEEVDDEGGIQDVIAWYKKAMGFRIECGRGVKFIFNNINPKDYLEEYFFTIRYENDTYYLMECNPYLSGVEEMMKELNSTTNGLFKFVRIMRNKFHDTAVNEATSVPEIYDQISANDNTVEEGSVLPKQKRILRNRHL